MKSTEKYIDELKWPIKINRKIQNKMKQREQKYWRKKEKKKESKLIIIVVKQDQNTQ